jgi:heme exporter protein B
MWRDALLVLGKDLRIETRARVASYQVLPFALAVLLLFGLALGPDRTRLQTLAPGLFWVTVLFASVLGVQRSFAVEAADDAADGLRISGLDPAGVFFGKAAALGCELVALELVLAVLTAFLYGVQLSGAALLLATCVAATAGLAGVGTIYGVLSIGTRYRETLLPLLFLPVTAPVVLAAVKASEAALAGTPGRGVEWLELLAIFAVAYLAIGTVAFGPLLEEG